MDSKTRDDELGSPADRALEEYLVRREEGRAEPSGVFLQAHEAHRPYLAAKLSRLGLIEEVLDTVRTETEAPESTPEHPVLGDFVIQGEIGRGGMGVVYDAQQTSLRRRVAVKVLRGHLTLDARALERFRREASITARLHHRGIIDIHEVGEEGGVHFFSMERIEGTSLDRVIGRLRREAPASDERLDAESPPLPELESAPVGSRAYIETAVLLVARVADALEYAHQAGVIHRDVKPANILVRPDGTPVLTDFGLAREQGLPSVSVTGEFAGTPHYVSPEQAMAHRVQVDHRTDVFSLGATLYELLTLRHAFQGASSQEVFAKILTKEPAHPRRLNRPLAPDLVTILFKSLEKDPDRRYSTARELAEDLRAFIEYRPIRARRAPRWRRVERWIHREPLRASLLALFALGTPTVLGLWMAYQSKAALAENTDRELREERAFPLVVRAYYGHLSVASLEELGQSLLEDPRAQPWQRSEKQARRNAHEGSLEIFREALGIHPAYRLARAGTVLSHLSAGEPDQALEAVETWPGGDTGEEWMLRLEAEALRRLDRAAEATLLEQGLGEPHAPLELFVAGCLERARATEGVVGATYRRAYELHTEAVRQSRDADGREATLFLFEQCFSALLAGERGEAEHIADELDRGVAPRLPSVDYVLGLIYYFAGRADKAIRRFEVCLDREPNWAQAANNLGYMYLHIGSPEKAVPRLRSAVDMDPDLAEARFNLALALERTNQIDQAVEEYERITPHDPNYGHALHNLAWIVWSEARLDDAMALFVQARDVAPEVPKTTLSLAEVQRRIHMSGRDILPDYPYGRAALENYGQALERGFRAPARYHLDFADLIESLGNPEDLTWFLEELASRSDDAAALNALVWQWIGPSPRADPDETRLGEALEVLTQALDSPETDPGDRAYYALTLSWFYLRKRDLPRAAELDQEAVTSLDETGDLLADWMRIPVDARTPDD